MTYVLLKQMAPKWLSQKDVKMDSMGYLVMSLLIYRNQQFSQVKSVSRLSSYCINKADEKRIEKHFSWRTWKHTRKHTGEITNENISSSRSCHPCRWLLRIPAIKLWDVQSVLNNFLFKMHCLQLVWTMPKRIAIRAAPERRTWFLHLFQEMMKR